MDTVLLILGENGDTDKTQKIMAAVKGVDVIVAVNVPGAEDYSKAQGDGITALAAEEVLTILEARGMDAQLQVVVLDTDVSTSGL